MGSFARIPARHVGPLLMVVVGAFLVVSLPRSPEVRSGGFHPAQTPQNHGPPEIDWRAGPRAPKKLTNGFGRRKPATGSPAWQALYPPQELGPRPLAQWMARYNYLRTLPADETPFAAVSAIPKASLTSNGQPEYPSEAAVDPGPEGICSFRLTGCVRGNGHEAPEKHLSPDVSYGASGSWAINFDDGPLPPSRRVYDFLGDKGQKATHFWIGSRVRDYPLLALEAARRGHHLAVHTYSHPHLSTLTDEQVIGELGWTMQIIFDLTGHVPGYYRPPYGDTDDRVRALAKHVFGLTTVLWNAETADWALDQRNAIGDFVGAPMEGFTVNNTIWLIQEFAKWNRADGAPGVVALEHELSDDSVLAFTDTFDGIRETGWKTGTLADCIGREWYQ